MNTFSLHLQEFQHRCFYLAICIFFTFLICCLEFQPLLHHLASPLKGTHLVITDLPEFWYATFQLAFRITIICIFPYLLYSLSCFIIPALHQNEFDLLISTASILLFLFLLGLGLSFFFFLPFFVYILFFSSPDPKLVEIDCFPKLLPYVSFVSSLIVLNFFGFQVVGIFILFLKQHLIPIKSLITSRKIVYILILLLSAFISPPDIISQFLLSFILFSVYEFSVFYCIWVQTDLKGKRVPA